MGNAIGWCMITCSDGRVQVWDRCIENLVFNVAYEKIGIAGSHFGAHGHAIDLFIITASTNSVAPSLYKPHTPCTFIKQNKMAKDIEQFLFQIV